MEKNLFFKLAKNMSTKSDIEITVHNKKQLNILIDKMLESSIIFTFSSPTSFEQEIGKKNMIDTMEIFKNKELSKNSASVGLAYYDEGYVLGIIANKELKKQIKIFLNSIKVLERKDETPVIIEDKEKDLTNLYIKSLDKRKAEQAKKLLSDIGIFNLNDRPYFE